MCIRDSRSLSYGEALKEAQKLGYAEADPSADVSGLDALRKIVLGSAVAYGVDVYKRQVVSKT